MARSDAKRERLDHKRALGRARSKRFYYRDKADQRVGRFLDTYELHVALKLTGLMKRNESVETGVARLHKLLSDDPTAFVAVISNALESGR